MDLEDYFDVWAVDDIRIKGTRVGIETVLFDYLFRDKTAEAIAQTYPSLTLEQVYATILYYLQNRSTVESYLQDWLEWGDRMRAQQASQSLAVVEKLRRLQAQKLAQVAQ